ncbi:hypothetical protein PDIDSM_4254 [Penicillium digitatum]|nr:hypothetical protein PDIDSM_4254 [Penicillium digitatum]
MDQRSSRSTSSIEMMIRPFMPGITPAPSINASFPTDAGFVGRYDLLDKLEHLLFSSDQQHKIAITGLGGVGKI